MIEKHITQVNNALTVLQRNIDLVLDRVLNAVWEPTATNCTT